MIDDGPDPDAGYRIDEETELESRNESDEDGEGIAPLTHDLDLNLRDLDPTAGASDIGGRAGGDDPTA